MQKVFIQHQNNEPITISTYAAKEGFRKMGYDVISFEKDTFQTELDISPFKGELFVGGINTLLNVIKLMGVESPKTYNPHDYLPQYCSRHIQTTVLEDAYRLVKNNINFFIKPAVDNKLFTGYVVKSEIDLLRLSKLDNTTPVLISDTINIISEYRCFVNRGNLVGVKHYGGYYGTFPNIAIIRKAIDDFQCQPISYTLDFAILANDNKMELIEINDGFGVGHYGLNPVTYCKFLEDRWHEIINS